MKFEEYDFAPGLIKGISELGFKRPTDIQYKSIPSILKGEDVLAVAQTGTGKTAAFAIPIINILHERKKRERRPDGIKCIVMVPTHELAMQLTEVFSQIGKYTQVRTFGIYGGVDQDPQIARLHERVDILIATPGRMFDLIAQGHLQVHRVEVLILDEADHMLDLGFIRDIRDMTAKLPKRRQTLFFSATINKKIKQLAYSLIHQDAIRIQISPKDPVSKNVDHAVVFVEMDDKRFFLERLIQENPDSKILVFVRTKVRAERVAKAMERVDIRSKTIHSGKEQSARTHVLEQFRSGEIQVLIATDVSARGIDIPDVEYVVNYDLPTDKAENYVHRIGRTGRGKKRGQAVSFCSKDERQYLEEIEKFINSEIEVIEVSTSEYKDTILFSDNSDLSTIIQAIDEIEDRERKKKKKRKK